ncbi:uncharacterized protein BKA55DRAFT_598141 [Fusarium redolens]|uniref:Uncharacterized protein n=1 Tax=Fusarium redolens TaxID=48865 RepID=A0A9P9G7I7_FUSRE|nr:uncharacterized protein BKA55DRAFT_598141 [Fusarium redolens]KAH7233956.1 hypothetical protein BKA55DRAFT_598141 [Fusarium redolens]
MAEFTIDDKDLTSLEGKVVIVTGGSSGIGLATVELLLSLGASVVCGDVQAPQKDLGGTYTFIKTDVSIWRDLLALFNNTKKIYGRIDHVFANAGVGPRTEYLCTDFDENGDAVEPSTQLLDISLKGVINTIVITGSATGLQRFRSVDYATAKHGVLGFGRALVPRLQEAQLPIRVNTLAPSWTDSNVLPSLKSLLEDIHVEVQPASVVARCAAYLMADTSRNGQLIHVQRGKYTEIDEAVLLPAYRRINGGSPSEDEVLRRLEEVKEYGMADLFPQSSPYW